MNTFISINDNFLNEVDLLEAQYFYGHHLQKTSKDFHKEIVCF